MTPLENSQGKTWRLIIRNLNMISSGFWYNTTKYETFPYPHNAGTGNVTIALPEGYRANGWTIQLRWPMQMEAVICWVDTIEEQTCGGDPTNSIDGVSCKGQHYHIKPFFWDANEFNLTREINPQWLNTAEYTLDNPPVPCIDWCDEGKIPEYRGPCTTQPPTTTTTPNPIDCDAACYEEYNACNAACAGDSLCATACNDAYFECFAN